jgi:hypothetical protein
VLTAEAVTLKAAEAAPVATVTDPGACSALLLLERVTTTGLVAAALKVTEQDLVCAPVSDCVPHESAANFATGAVVGGGDSVIAAVCETPSAVAVRIAVCVVLRADAVTLKAAAVAPAATFTEVGA